MERIVYRGCDYSGEVDIERPIFFSSSKDFASEYGRVARYHISINNPFDTCSKADVNRLLKKVHVLKDEYSGETFQTFDELKESNLLYHDTWEIFESHIKEIRALDHDGMVIYEGGIQNFITFKRDAILNKVEI